MANKNRLMSMQLFNIQKPSKNHWSCGKVCGTGTTFTYSGFSVRQQAVFCLINIKETKEMFKRDDSDGTTHLLFAHYCIIAWDCMHEVLSHLGV